ncbi:MAG TPA: hypothetical protein DGT21_14245 [Armatimonadetes bacterium]|nr:hypothetical protein [Armatimonadota bacterium]
MDGLSHMPGEDPAEKLYELAQHQFEYERYDMAAAYARRALQSVSDIELGERLRELLRQSEAAEAAFARARGRAALSQRPEHQDRPRWRRRQSEPEDEPPARSMLDDDDTDTVDDVVEPLVVPRPAAQRPAVLSSSPPGRPPLYDGRPPPSPAPPTAPPPPPAAPAASPRAGSCMHCGHPLPDRSIVVCPGCGQDPLVDVTEDSEAPVVADGGASRAAPVRRMAPPASATPAVIEEPPERVRRLPRAVGWGWVAVALIICGMVAYTLWVRSADQRQARELIIYGRMAVDPLGRTDRGRGRAPDDGAAAQRAPDDRDSGRIRTSTRIGKWEGTGSWTTPTFTLGESWSIEWATSPGAAGPGAFNVTLHRTADANTVSIARTNGADDGVTHGGPSGSTYLEIVTQQAWEITVWNRE